MALQRLLLPLGAAVVAACEIPARDNPHDPDNAPDFLVQANPISGGRSTEFHFTAVISSDAGCSIAWELDDPRYDAGDPDDFDTDGDETLDTFLTLTTGMFDPASQGAVAIPRRVRAQARCAQGIAEAGVDVVLVNTAPIADAGEDLFVSEQADAYVVLDACGGGSLCTSTDAEGDSLQYEWSSITDPSLDPVELDPAGRRAAFTMTDDMRRPIIFKVVASDGLAESAAFVTVNRATQIWLGTFAPQGLYRIFPGFQVLRTYEDGGAAFFGAPKTIELDSSGELWIGNGSSPEVMRLTTDRVLLDSWSIAGSSVHSVAPLGSGGACVANLNFPDTEFRRLSPGGVVSGVLATGVGKTEVYRVAQTNRCWIKDKTSVRILEANGSVTPVASGFANLRGATTRPDGSLWVADGGGIVSRLDGSGGRTDFSDPAVTSLGGIAEHPSGVWLHGSQKLLVLTTAGSWIETDAAPSLITTTNHKSLVGDVVGRAVWVTDFQQNSLRRFVDTGAAHVIETANVPVSDMEAPGSLLATVAVVSTDGSLFASTFGGATSGTLARIPAHGRKFEQVPGAHGSYFSIAADVSRGSLWVTDGNLSRISGEGRNLFEPRAIGAGGVVAMPDGTAWIGVADRAGSGIRHVDTDGQFVGDALDLGTSALGAIGGSEEAVCGLSAADPGNFVDAEPFRIDPTAPQLESFSTIVGETPISAVASAGGGCWFATGCTGNTPDRVFYVPPGASDPTSQVMAANGTDFASCSVALAADPADDGVWVVDAQYDDLSGDYGRLVHLTVNGVADAEYTYTYGSMQFGVSDGVLFFTRFPYYVELGVPGSSLYEWSYEGGLPTSLIVAP